jgi:hypothetical protein
MILDLKKGHHIIFRSFLEQQDLFDFGSFASLLSVLWLKTWKNNKKMPIKILSKIYHNCGQIFADFVLKNCLLKEKVLFCQLYKKYMI